MQKENISNEASIAEHKNHDDYDNQEESSRLRRSNNKRRCESPLGLHYDNGKDVMLTMQFLPLLSCSSLGEPSSRRSRRSTLCNNEQEHHLQEEQENVSSSSSCYSSSSSTAASTAAPCFRSFMMARRKRAALGSTMTSIPPASPPSSIIIATNTNIAQLEHAHKGQPGDASASGISTHQEGVATFAVAINIAQKDNLDGNHHDSIAASSSVTDERSFEHDCRGAGEEADTQIDLVDGQMEQSNGTASSMTSKESSDESTSVSDADNAGDHVESNADDDDCDDDSDSKSACSQQY
jgi:hypothetical protein